jgi:hypothetical protein
MKMADRGVGLGKETKPNPTENVSRPSRRPFNPCQTREPRRWGEVLEVSSHCRTRSCRVR